MNCENSKTSDPHRPLLHLTNNINFKRSDKYVLYQILASAIHRKI